MAGTLSYGKAMTDVWNKYEDQKNLTLLAVNGEWWEWGCVSCASPI